MMKNGIVNWPSLRRRMRIRYLNVSYRRHDDLLLNFRLVSICDPPVLSLRQPMYRGHVEKVKISRKSGYPHRIVLRTSGPSRNARPTVYGETSPRSCPTAAPATFYTSVFQLPPSPFRWTPMETVASWHGEVNYKRYQSLGVVGRLVGLGSTDSQLPLRADPRARAIASSLSLSSFSSLPLPSFALLSLPLPHFPSSLTLSLSRSLPHFLPRRPFVLPSVTGRDSLTPQAKYSPRSPVETISRTRRGRNGLARWTLFEFPA